MPKYLNSRETDIYRKGSVLFGLHEGLSALSAGAVPVIVEGPVDAMAVTVAGGGRYAGVAPCGTAFTASQLGSLSGACDLRSRSLGEGSCLEQREPLVVVPGLVEGTVQQDEQPRRFMGSSRDCWCTAYRVRTWWAVSSATSCFRHVGGEEWHRARSSVCCLEP